MLLNNNLNTAKNKHLLLVGLNVAASFLIVVVLLAVSASKTFVYSDKAHLTGIFSRITTFKSQLTLDYAYLGHWPEKRILETKEDYDSGLIEEVIFDGNGSINVYFASKIPRLKGKILSFTAAHLPLFDEEQPDFKNFDINSLAWVCGYAKVPELFILLSENKTNIDPRLLPRSCKSKSKPKS